MLTQIGGTPVAIKVRCWGWVVCCTVRTAGDVCVRLSPELSEELHHSAVQMLATPP